MPGSATPAEQLADAGIDADAIATAARALVSSEAPVPAEVGS
jgi:transketolase